MSPTATRISSGRSKTSSRAASSPPITAEIADMTTTDTRPRMSQRLSGSTSEVSTCGTVRSASSQSFGPPSAFVAVVIGASPPAGGAGPAESILRRAGVFVKAVTDERNST